jgi:hypothetical protein
MSAIEPMISLPTPTSGGCRDRRRCHEEDRSRQEERDRGLNATGLGREARIRALEDAIGIDRRAPKTRIAMD